MRKMKVNCSLTYEEAMDVKRQCPYNVLINADLDGLTVIGDAKVVDKAAEWISKQATVKVSLAKKKIEELRTIVNKAESEDEIQADEQVEEVPRAFKERKKSRRTDK